LILNGGVVGCKDSVTIDGLETHVAVNHLAGYYLATLLLDTMIQTVKKNKNDVLAGMWSRIFIIASFSNL
jgi:hypothetical protein